MTQEEKQLLLKDLCGRLPYRLKFQSYHSECGIEGKGTFDFEIGDDVTLSKLKDLCESGNNKPYLRPMSSMTEEEKDELCKLCDFEKSYDDRDYFTHYGIEVISEYCVGGKKIPESVINYSVIDFFYEHHLDWRGLIPMGLALEAPEDMYK